MRTARSVASGRFWKGYLAELAKARYSVFQVTAWMAVILEIIKLPWPSAWLVPVAVVATLLAGDYVTWISRGKP